MLLVPGRNFQSSLPLLERQQIRDTMTTFLRQTRSNHLKNVKKPTQVENVIGVRKIHMHVKGLAPQNTPFAYTVPQMAITRQFARNVSGIHIRNKAISHKNLLTQLMPRGTKQALGIDQYLFT